MKFRILGAVEALGEDGPVDLGPPRQRLVLAVLLSNVGEVVSDDGLIDAVWGEEPPKTAPENLRVYVYKLRKILGGGIERAERGYVLRAQPGQVDARVFEERMAEAAAERDLSKSRELYGAALELWRGPAFGRLAREAALRPRASRLNEQRLRALEARLDCDLDLGRHAEVVGELTELVTAHPLREKFRAQLMVALYRSGRQAEALGVYDDARRALADELGLDPGADLRSLHQAILAEDPDLRVSSHSAPPPPRAETPVVPAELPFDLATFTGRAQEVDRLVGELTAPERHVAVLAVGGAGGIGKSVLAIHVAHLIAAEFPDGQLYVNLRGATPGAAPLSSRDVLARFLRALGVRDQAIPEDVEEAAGRFRSLTADRRMLFLLDDAADAAQVRPLLPGGTGCAVVITSRRTLATLDGVTHLRLGVLPETEALELLVQIVGRERVAADPGAAREIVRLCGQLPLAVRIAGARLVARPALSLGTLAERLRDARRPLDELEHADLGVRTSLALAYESLAAEHGGEEALRLFEYLGLPDAVDISAPVITALAGERARESIERLVEARLVDVRAPGRYALHDLMRLFAREKAEENRTAGEREAAVRRVVHFYLGTVRDAVTLLDPADTSRLKLGPATERPSGFEFSARADALGWVDAEAGNLVLIARQAASLPGDGPAEAAAIAAALYRPFEQRRPVREYLSLVRIGLEAARKAGDRRAEATLLGDLAHGTYRQNLPETAEHLTRAIEIWRDLGDSLGEARTLNMLGALRRRERRFDDAVGCFQRSRELHRELGNPAGEAAVTTNLGTAYADLGRLSEAIDSHRESLALSRTAGDVRSEAIALCNLGEALLVSGDSDGAISSFSASIEPLREAGDRAGEAEMWWGLGQAHQAAGDSTKAWECWRKSLAILRETSAITADEVKRILASPNPGVPEPIQAQR